MFHREQQQTTLNGKAVITAGAVRAAEDFVTEELCEARRDGLMKDCGFHSDRIKALERKQDAIDQKISATLVFGIISLAAIIIFKLFGVNI